MNVKSRSAFSLVEVVIALGIFAFCVTVLLGLIPIGLKSARSVSEEGNAVHIASSVFGFWQTAPAGAAVAIPGVISNALLAVGAAGSSTNDFFDESGGLAVDPAKASLRMDYRATALAGVPNAYEVELTFQWPPNAASNSPPVQSRVFKEVFVK